MDDSAKRSADELTEQAFATGEFEDLRESYRNRLRWIKENQPQAFTAALSHYNEVLVPNIAAGSSPIREWLDYGRRLGELSARGRFVRVDETGRAHTFDEQMRGLILHLPDDTNIPAFALAVPRDLSEAQRATLDLLVPRR